MGQLEHLQQQATQGGATTVGTVPALLVGVEGARRGVEELRTVGPVGHEGLDLVSVINPVQGHRRRVGHKRPHDGANLIVIDQPLISILNTSSTTYLAVADVA